MKVTTIFGTRPEAIKMIPLIKELKKHTDITTEIIVTGQHREMLYQILNQFKIKPDYDLNVMEIKQNLTTLTSTIINKLTPILEKTSPDIILVHGDTTTTFAAALAAFYQKIHVGHVEAGLRTYDKYAPYPEEVNRQLTTVISDYHFAPTNLAKENLLKENIPESKIVVTGNTIVDMLNITTKMEISKNVYSSEDERLILLTVHRRENQGNIMKGIFEAIKKIVMEFPDVKVVFPVHLNPDIQKIAFEELNEYPRIELISPLDVLEMHHLMQQSYLVLTDSGGLQEEAASLDVPVLVLRKTTERPEGVASGVLKLIGNERDAIYKETKKLLNDTKAYEEMRMKNNPYGDGHASKRIVQEIKKEFSKGE